MTRSYTAYLATALFSMLLMTGSEPSLAAINPDAPHSTASGFSCIACHATHPVLGGTGYNNICLNCHRPGFPRGGGKPFTEADMANPFGTYTATRNGILYQTSHAWQGSDTVAKAGALPPIQAALTASSLRARTSEQLACVRCHNQHDNTNGKFLRVANDQDQLCLDCHRQRNTIDHKNGTHPVGIDYAARTAGNVKFKGFSASSGLKLINGKILCSSCHGVHYADSRAGTVKTAAGYNNLSTGDGNLLRTALRGAQPDSPNLCTTCHIGKFSHNKRGQNVQCGDCHGGHVDPGDGTTVPNVRLVNRLMNFSSALRSARNKPVFFQSTAVRNYKDTGGNGVCQSCHDIPLGAGFQSFHNVADTTGCTNCHTHGNPQGSYSVDANTACNACHGYPPVANTEGGPDGYAAGSPFTAEATGGHPTHAVSPYHKACTECHNGNSHLSGTFQDLFIDTVGSVAATGGLIPVYTAGTFTCANVYCHSNGAPRTGITPNAPLPAAIPSWNNGNGVITGQANAVRCNFCHAAPIATNSHTTHIDAAGYAIACAVCHAATVSGTTFAATTILDVSRHTNAVKNVAFGGIALNGTWAEGTAACSNLYCHSNVQGSSGSGAPSSYATPRWGIDNGSIGCGSCHLNMATDASGTGSHKTHAQAPYTYSCGVCHAGYTNAAVVTSTHSDNFINLSFTAPASNGGTTPSYYGGNTKAPGSGFQQCLNGYCHSTVQNATTGANSGITYKNPVWGNAASVGACGGCHVNMATDTAGTGSHAVHARIYAMACSTCHSGAGKDPVSGVASTLHADGIIEIAFSGAIATGTVYSQSSNQPGGGYGSCDNSYCHSNGTSTTAPFTHAGVSWSGDLNCGNCHNKAGDGAWSGSAAHLTHVTTYFANGNFSCNACHASTASDNAAISNPSNHVNMVRNVSFNAFAGGAFSGGVCNNVYCHSNGRIAGPTYATVAWTDGSRSCGDCHGTSVSGTLTPTHTPHTNNAAVIGTNFTCSDCHAKTIAIGNGSITDFSKHVNKLADYSGIKAGGSTSYNSSTKVCSNIYCHSSGKRGVVAATTEPANPVWDAGTLNCKGCHGARSTASAGVAFNSIAGEPNYSNAGSGLPGANSHQQHVSAATDCISCHFNTASAAGNAIVTPAGQRHIDRVIDVIWNPTNPSVSSITWTSATKTCSNIVCHGGNSAIWGGNVPCIDCHGSNSSVVVYMANPLTNPWATGRSSGTAGKINTIIWESTGHGRPVASGAYPVSGNPAANLSGSNGCFYCHDPAVQHQTATGVNPMRLRNYSSAAWGRNQPCMTCHAKGGTTVTIGTLPGVPVQTRISSLHYGSIHNLVSNNTGGRWCWDCHNPHGDSANIFMIRDQVSKKTTISGSDIGAPALLATASFTATNSATDYFGAGKICSTCHTAANPALSDFSHDLTASGPRCVSCHSHNGPTKIDAFMPSGGHNPYPGASHLSAAGTTPWGSCITAGCHTNGNNSNYPFINANRDCTGCHINGLRVPVGTSSCWDCHGSSATNAWPNGAAFPNINGSHTSHSGTTLNAGLTCDNCHNGSGAGTAGHGSSNRTASTQAKAISTLSFSGVAVSNSTTATSCATTWCHGGNTTLIPQNNPARSAPVWGTPFPVGSTLGTGGTAGTSGSGFCAQCHGYPPRNAMHAGKIASSCIGCHAHLNNDGLTFNDATKHVNGVIDGGGDCITCHATAQTGGRRIITGASGDFVKTSHHVTNGTTNEIVTINACTVCHGNIVSDRSHPNGTPAFPNVDLLDPDLNSTYVANTPAGVEQVCAKCHDSNGAARTTPALPAGSTATQPFNTAGDTRTPVNISWTPASMAHSYRTVPAVGGGCLGCHSNSHGNANAKLLIGAYNSASAQTFCYNCHGTTTAGGAQTSIQPLFAKSRKHSVQSCSNCHDPHQAKPDTHTVQSNTAGGVLNGVAGARLSINPAFWAAPASGNFTSTTIVSGTDLEATLCFKCHTVYSGTYNAASPSGSFAMTDIAREFNPANVGNFAGSWANGETAGGFHPVLGTAGSNLGAINLANLTVASGFNRTTRNLMTCSDCHGSDTTTDPLGPHGSAANFLLRGPNTTWNNTIAATSTGMPAGVFCANCHSSTWASSRFTGTQHYSRSAHRVPCMNCHAAIPHGGPRPGMLVAPAGRSANVPAYADWEAAPYSNPGTGSRLYIVSYPPNNSTSWGESNCGCNGSSH